MLSENAGSDAIEQVLNQVLPTMEGHEEGDILVEWVLVAYVENVNNDDEHGYPMLYSNGNMPTYRARGLLETALNKINNPE